jgi:competence protein ComEC
VSFSVLHPPARGPAGKENVRSLVLLVRHRSWSMLLTGDLEEAGLTQVLAKKAPPIDVLMAPHHGSDKSNVAALAQWAKPKLVVSCQTAPTSERASVKMYERMGAKFLGTWPHGAITIRPDDVEAPVQTYRSRLTLKPW